MSVSIHSSYSVPGAKLISTMLLEGLCQVPNKALPPKEGREREKKPVVKPSSSLGCITYKTKPVDNLPIDVSGIS